MARYEFQVGDLVVYDITFSGSEQYIGLVVMIGPGGTQVKTEWRSLWNEEYCCIGWDSANMLRYAKELLDTGRKVL